MLNGHPLPSALGSFSSVFTNETYRRERKECYEREPKHKKNNLKDPLALIEEAVPRK
jgi:hypothetical protein